MSRGIRLISHRGNLVGEDASRENMPEFVDKALERGFDCEVDLWGVGASLYLGHDGPQTPIEVGWLNERTDKLWVHCKNRDAIVAIHQESLNWFFHQNDPYTLTSKGFVWAFPGQPVAGLKTVSVWFGEADPINELPLKGSWGICGNFVGAWK